MFCTGCPRWNSSILELHSSYSNQVPTLNDRILNYYVHNDAQILAHATRAFARDIADAP